MLRDLPVAAMRPLHRRAIEARASRPVALSLDVRGSCALLDNAPVLLLLPLLLRRLSMILLRPREACVHVRWQQRRLRHGPQRQALAKLPSAAVHHAQAQQALSQPLALLAETVTFAAASFSGS